MIPHIGFVLCFTLVATTAAGAASGNKKPEPLALKMSAYVSSVQSDVIVRMRVEPDARSRQLTLEWIADDLSGGSTAISLDGARAAMTHQFPLRRLTPGYYTVVGVGGPESIGGRRGAAAGASR